MKETGTAVLAVGDVFNGMRFIGPFNCMLDAVDYADLEIRDENWNAADLQVPIQFNSGDQEVEHDDYDPDGLTIILVGNPIEGGYTVGPFKEEMLACAYGRTEAPDPCVKDYWPADLEAPKKTN